MSAANNRLMVKYEPESTDLICVENRTDIIIRRKVSGYS